MTHLFLAGLLGLAPAQPDDPLPPGAVARMGTTPDTYWRLAQTFSRHHFDDGAVIAQALLAHDFALGARLAHTLRGAAATLGGDALAASAGALEVACETEDPVLAQQILQALLPRLEKLMQSLAALPPPAAVVVSPPIADLPDDLEARLTQLDQLLAAGDSTARELVRGLQGIAGLDIKPLLSAITAYDFELARQRLQELRRRITP